MSIFEVVSQISMQQVTTLRAIDFNINLETGETGEAHTMELHYSLFASLPHHLSQSHAFDEFD